MSIVDHQFEITGFTEADRPELRSLYKSVKLDTFGKIGLPEENTDTFDEDTRGESILVAKVGGTNVGFVAIWPPENFIHHLYVRKDFHRMGIGRGLIEAVRAQSAGTLTLKCVASNEEAVKFYKKNGWVVRSQGVTDHGPFLLFELS